MEKKVLILSGSPRKGGNSDLLCDAMLRGAREAGHEAEKIMIGEKKIGFCRACYGCRDRGACVLGDDMAPVLEKMQQADVIVLASPVYFYSIDAQMKAVIDRTLPKWTQLKNKEFYYILTAADPDPAAMDGALACFRGFAVCLEGAEERGVLMGNGLYEAGEAKSSPYLQQAYEMGKNM